MTQPNSASPDSNSAPVPWWVAGAAAVMTGQGLGQAINFFVKPDAAQFSIWSFMFLFLTVIQHLGVKFRAGEPWPFLSAAVMATAYTVTLNLHVHYLVLAVIYLTWTVDFLTSYTWTRPTSQT